MENICLFVYGSLRKGFTNHKYLAESEYIGEHASVDQFQLITHKNGNYPYLLDEPLVDYPSTIVHGEIYKINSKVLKNIDSLESNSKIYQRKIYTFINQNNEIIEAWIYILTNYEMTRYIAQKMDKDFVMINSGNWRDFKDPSPLFQ